ncbi:MAG: hypothetical protein WCV00_19775 [Verrucomicrobiia bacterium]|jgi:hypothetical protein
MMPRPAIVSIVDPISPAIERVKNMLFRPFDLAKWMTIGFCAWLATLGEGGFNGGNFNSPSHGKSGDIHRQFEQAKAFVLSNLNWIIPLAVALVIIGFAVGLLMIWLNSRGQFMFLHCVALNVAEVRVPWNKFKTQGNSLFWFRFVVHMIGTVLTLPLLIMCCFPIYRMFSARKFITGDIMELIGILLVLMLFGCIFMVIAKLTADFVVPIMFLRGSKCVAAWREFLSLVSSNVGRFVLYLLFQVFLQVAIGITVLLILVFTCCLCFVGCCLLILPYIGTVMCLPILVFDRSYSLYYLQQYGSDFNVFKPASPSTVAPPAQAIR